MSDPVVPVEELRRLLERVAELERVVADLRAQVAPLRHAVPEQIQAVAIRVDEADVLLAAFDELEGLRRAAREAIATFDAGCAAADADGYWPGPEWSAFMQAMDVLEAALTEEETSDRG